MWEKLWMELGLSLPTDPEILCECLSRCGSSLCGSGGFDQCSAISAQQFMQLMIPWQQCNFVISFLQANRSSMSTLRKPEIQR